MARAGDDRWWASSMARAGESSSRGNGLRSQSARHVRRSGWTSGKKQRSSMPPAISAPTTAPLSSAATYSTHLSAVSSRATSSPVATPGLRTPPDVAAVMYMSTDRMTPLCTA
eukprot:3391569-Prymnesium_polylepis.1